MALVCPSCGTPHEDGRFCSACGMPLTPDAPAPAVSERQERARKVLPQYGEGELVKVGWARNQPEAELLSGMLLEEGIPSVAKRSGGFDVPDFIAAGPRDILVAESGAEAARAVLGSRAPAAPPRSRPAPRWVRALALLLVVVVLGLVLAGVVAALVG
ncbi:MAG TPA: hypothetical protein VM266_05770 [Solirubrobacteraceae bacterium]|nr:hypothetical protein [Solirubrobacteraceae bacterium]